jgi:hypothetical protein
VIATRILAFALAVPLVAQETGGNSWARVSSIPAGTRISIRLINGEVPRNSRPVKGVLNSVDENSVVLRGKDSSIRSIPRPSIRTLKVYQPVRNRTVAWYATGSAATFMLAGFPHLTPGSASPWDGEHLPITLLMAAALAVPVWLIASRATRYRVVYRAG